MAFGGSQADASYAQFSTAISGLYAAYYPKLVTGDAKTATDLLNAIAGGIEDATASYVTAPVRQLAASELNMSRIISLGHGRMSVFGGPADEGVGPHEGLALVGPTDLALWWFSCCSCREQPAGTTGLARRLNPRAYYLAMRWDYAVYPREALRYGVVRLSVRARSGMFSRGRSISGRGMGR